jgi:hypothetical protein
MESDDKNVCRLLVMQNNLFCRVTIIMRKTTIPRGVSIAFIFNMLIC